VGQAGDDDDAGEGVDIPRDEAEQQVLTHSE
jgi:hypothetical protein